MRFLQQSLWSASFYSERSAFLAPRLALCPVAAWWSLGFGRQGGRVEAVKSLEAPFPPYPPFPLPSLFSSLFPVFPRPSPLPLFSPVTLPTFFILSPLHHHPFPLTPVPNIPSPSLTLPSHRSSLVAGVRCLSQQLCFNQQTGVAGKTSSSSAGLGVAGIGSACLGIGSCLCWLQN